MALTSSLQHDVLQQPDRNHSVVLLSNRGKAIDLDKLWEKLSGLIDNHVED
jgi:hypothetical protein